MDIYERTIVGLEAIGIMEDGKSHRSSDPGNKKDEELYNKPTYDYKNAMNDYEKNKSLGTFGNLPATRRVYFKQYTGNPKEKGKLNNIYYAEK